MNLFLKRLFLNRVCGVFRSNRLGERRYKSSVDSNTRCALAFQLDMGIISHAAGWRDRKIRMDMVQVFILFWFGVMSGPVSLHVCDKVK